MGRSGFDSYVHGVYGQLALSRDLKVLLKPGRVPCAMERGHCEQCQGANSFPLGVTSVEPLSCRGKTGLPV